MFTSFSSAITFVLAVALLLLLAYSAGRVAVLYRGLKQARRRDRFGCLRCGRCCRHYRINVTEDDIRRLESRGLAGFLDREGKHLKKVDGACVFLGKDNMCSVHSFKPEACRTWPFNRRILGRFLVARRFGCPGLKKLLE